MWLPGITSRFRLSIFTLYKGGNVGPGLWTADSRNFNIDDYEMKIPDLDNTTCVYLTYGQSNSANSGEFGYTVRRPVLQFLLWETFAYEDPLLGATGAGVSCLSLER